MRLLLDTQVLLWYLLDDPRLSECALKCIRETSETVFVSPASLWETAIKISLEKHELPVPFAEFWDRRLQESIPAASNDTVFDAYGIERIWKAD